MSISVFPPLPSVCWPTESDTQSGFQPGRIAISSPVVAVDEDDAEDDFEGEIDTPDFEGLEDFDDEDFDDEFDDDFEEELEDEYDFDEFDENVTDEDLDDAEGDLPLDGDFVDEDAEEEGPAVTGEEPEKE